MKRVIIVLVGLIISITAYSGEIKFLESNWDKIIKKAKKENKIIFVDAYADWCGPCKWMGENVFSDNDVANFYNENFINVRFDMESELGIEFEKTFEVSAYPTLMFISPDGKLIKKRVGALDADKFLKLAKGVLNPEETDYFKLTEEYKNGNRAKDFLVDYALVLYGEDEEISDEVFSEYFNGMVIDSLLSENSFIMFYLDKDDITSENSEYFAENYDLFYETIGEYADTKFINILENALDKIINDKLDENIIYEYVDSALKNDKDRAKEINDEIERIIKEN